MTGPKSCSLRELARQRGISDKVVRKAIASGRLKESVGHDEKGRPFIRDIDLAIAELRQNAGRTSVRTEGSADGSAPAGSAAESAGPTDRTARIISAETLVDAQRMATLERARRDRMANDLREGRLVEVEKAAKVAFEAERTIREAVLNVTARIAAELAAETDAARVHILLDAALREALNVAAVNIKGAARA
jgi:hypothetical protein